MSTFDETYLRAQLSGRGEHRFTVEDISEMSGRLNNRGEQTSARDYLRFLYTLRHESTIKRRPERVDLHLKLRAVVEALEALPTDEPIYSWRVATPSRSFNGFSARSCLILYGPDFGLESSPST